MWNRGAGVKQLQKTLNAVNFRAGAEDGILGASTEDSVRRFQAVYLKDKKHLWWRFTPPPSTMKKYGSMSVWSCFIFIQKV